MSDILAETRSQIEARLGELRPLLAEYERLRAAHDALAALPSNGRAAARGGRKRATGRPRSSTAAKRGAVRPRGRTNAGRKRTGVRATESLQIIQGPPGITIPELAQKLGIKQNYLYRVLPALQKEKKIRKDGKGWRPVN